MRLKILSATMVMFSLVGVQFAQGQSAPLWRILASENVVTNEVDPVFSDFKNSKYSISLGYGAESSTSLGIAMGMPAWLNYLDMPLYAGRWRADYLRNVFADRESVAIGNSAQARQPVSVALGDQAIVGNLHGRWNEVRSVEFKRIKVETKIQSGVVQNVTTTYLDSVTREYDLGMYERIPQAGDWTKDGPEQQRHDGDEVVKSQEYIQKEEGGLPDISFMDESEWDFYNRLISGGQGTYNLTNALYGVAVGSRSYVFGYHSVAYGHYSHASRPWGMAIGSESHVYSEGGHGFGYDTDIASGSPYSMAVGPNCTIPSGMTNAIVIGVPRVVDFTNKTYRSSEGMIRDRPTAMKSNSINFVFHGNGLKDFFVDGVSLKDRI